MDLKTIETDAQAWALSSSTIHGIAALVGALALGTVASTGEPLWIDLAVSLVFSGITAVFLRQKDAATSAALTAAATTILREVMAAHTTAGKAVDGVAEANATLGAVVPKVEQSVQATKAVTAALLTATEDASATASTVFPTDADKKEEGLTTDR